MIAFEPDVLITIAWCVYGIIVKILPNEIGLFRELSLALLIIFSRKKLRFKNMHFMCIIFSIYYFLIGVIYEGITNSLHSSISMLSWIITLFVFSAYSKQKKDMKLIFNFCIYSGLLVSIILLLNNELFSNDMIINLNNGMLVNRNTVMYYIFPGYLFQLIKISRKEKNTIFDFIVLGILIFACLQINSRSMYISLIVCSLLVLNRQISSMIKKRKVFGVIMLVSFVIISIYFIFSILPDEYITREFNNMLNPSDTGRFELWSEAIGMVKNPLFGMGPGYYETHVSYAFGEYGAHNLFVDLYVSCGIIGSILFILILSFFIKNNMIVLSIIFPAFLTFFVEAGRTFFPYMLLIIAWFIIEGAKNNNQTINEFIDECVSKNTKGLMYEKKCCK